MFGKRSKVDIVEAPDTLGNRSLDPQVMPGYQKTKEEKRFLLKLDIFLLTFGCISQVIKYLDQTNISVAYVSGMQEALALNGNQLNYFSTWFNVGYCIFLIPSQVMITRFKPSLWLSSLEFIWGSLTLGIAYCKSYKQVYVLRALIGVAESSAYPGTVTLLMTWYTPMEMAKRVGFYHSCQAVGGLLSSALQTAIQSNLDGKYGIAGWQWCFILNGIMTLCVAVCGLFMIPDFPNRPNKWAFWLKDNDVEIANERLKRFVRKSPDPINWKCARRTFVNPMLYLMIYIYTGMLIANSGTSYFNLWLKSLLNADGTKQWTTTQLNAIPLGGFAMQISAVWFFAFGSDYFKTRWLMLLIQCLIGLPASIIMTIWNVPNGAKYYSYFTLYLTNASGPVLWAWMSDMLPRDAEQRALIIGVCITMYYAVNAWANILIWPAKQAPHYLYGWPVALTLFITCGLLICALRVWDVRVIRPRNKRVAEEVIDNATLFANTLVAAPDTSSPLDDKSDEAYKRGGSDIPATNVTVLQVK